MVKVVFNQSIREHAQIFPSRVIWHIIHYNFNSRRYRSYISHGLRIPLLLQLSCNMRNDMHLHPPSLCCVPTKRFVFIFREGNFRRCSCTFQEIFVLAHRHKIYSRLLVGNLFTPSATYELIFNLNCKTTSITNYRLF